MIYAISYFCDVQIWDKVAVNPEKSCNFARQRHI